jgi:competence protein ComEA
MSDEPAPRPVPHTVVAARGWEPLVERLRELRADARVKVLALLIVALAAGLIWYRIGLGRGSGATTTNTNHGSGIRSQPQRASTRSTGSSTSTSSTTAPPTELVVHVSGAVTREGLVRVPPGARVADAVAAAGGALPGADLRRLNLAAKVLDGQQVAVPIVGEPVRQSANAGAGLPSSETPLDLNNATAAQIETLPGIGPSLAGAIVAERERSGGFRMVDDLRRVRGIGDSRFAQLRPLVRV